jgi:FG-GAP-like repeat/Abnormal spindle-like microcephaly-assoc'd, ASPM-SPD-2-Hydin
VKFIRFVYFCLIFAGTLAIAQSNPVPLINQPLVPVSAVPGGAGFTLTVNGTGFVSGATINWNGAALTTTFVTGSQLTATVPASDIAIPNTASVTVVNPAPGGGTSSIVFFPVASPESNVFLSMSSVTTGLRNNVSILEGDFNADGIPDVVAADQTDAGLAILFGNGNGTFQPPLPIVPKAGYQPTLVSTGDFNNDGNLDFLISDPSLILQVLLGNGSGSFTAVNMDLSSFTSQLRGVIQGDFNGDGKLDVVCYCESLSVTYAVEVLLGNGDGTFQSPIQSPTASTQNGLPGPVLAPGTTADFNGDGKLDLVVMGGVGSPGLGIPGEMQILLGNGDGTFSQGQIYSLSPDFIPAYAAAADFNGDGKLDLAVAETYPGGLTGGGDLLVFLGNGDGTFQSPTLYQFTGAGGYPESMTTADFNGDGELDVAVMVGCPLCGTTPVIFYGNGDGTFRESLVSIVNGTLPVISSSAVGDFNSDGRLDFLAGSGSPGSFTLLSQVPQPQVPAATFSPTSLIFGPQPIGTTSPPQTITLTNTGTAPLTISSITITGANLGDYAQTNNCGTSVPINASCQIKVTFTPTAPGARDAAVSVTDNAPDSPQNVSLAGNLPLAAVFFPSSLTFLNQAIGTTSPPQTTTLTNLGLQTLTISSIAITGADAGDYAQTNNCGSSLVSNANCQIKVTFTPTAGGVRTAAVSVSDNAPGSPQAVSLMGNVPTSSVTLSPSAVTFPNQYVGTSGLPQSVTLTNTGNAAVTISSVIATPGDFGIINACGSSVPAGTNCTIGVFFDPTASGTRTGTLTVTDSASNSPQTTSLRGIGQDFSIAPESQSSATVSPGQIASYTVVVTPAGQFNQQVMLSCSGAPMGATCSVPSSVTLSASAPTPVNVTVSTTATSANLSRPRSFSWVRGELAVWLFGLPVLVVLSTSRTGDQTRRRRLLQVLAFLCLVSIGVTMSACGGGSAAGAGGGGTPAGTYNLTVTGTFTSGSNILTHNTTLKLMVQ